MKKKWIEPQIQVQEFVANEYVAACITGTIQCVYPGKRGAKGDNGVYNDYHGDPGGWYKDESGKLHGMCGYDATISFNGDEGSGFERDNGVIQRNRPIYNINGYEQKAGKYDVTWNSTDGNDTYTHKGRLIITNVDDTRPNHS